jgi:23S rRNA (uracil1939-C5)-methyltransferase
LKKNISTLILKVELPAYGGQYLGRSGGKVVFIKGAVLPGETVKVSVEKEYKDYFRAKATEIITPSIHRIDPPCKFFGSCGGCHLQHTPCKSQLLLKESILRDTLRRVAKTDIELSKSVRGGEEFNYRFRGQFKVSDGRIGFYREKSRDLIEIDNCPLMKDEINEYLSKSKPLLKDVTAKEIHISCGSSSLTALLKIPSAGEPAAICGRLAPLFISAGFSGLFIDTGDNVIFKYGKPYITLNLEDLQYTVSPEGFLQSNWRVNQIVVKLIKKSLQPLKGRKILDLFAGGGNLSLSLAEDAEVTAVEGNPYSIEDGMRNLEINRIKNYKYINSSAEDFKADDRFDVIILDPPRPGLTKRAINNVLSMRPERIVYISCNPATFSRDLKKLTARYDLESVRMIDLFPQTFHIEALAFLRLM